MRRVLLVYPPLDRSPLPPLATATLLAAVRAALGADAGRAVDLNLALQDALVGRGAPGVSPCCDTGRLQALTAFIEQNGWQADEGALLLPSSDTCVTPPSFETLLHSPLGRFLADALACELRVPTALVGISVCYPSQLIPALFLARITRQLSPRSRVVLGGPHIALHAPLLRDLLWLQDVDDVVLGPGEGILLELVGRVPTRSFSHRPVIVRARPASLRTRKTPDFSDLSASARGWPAPALPYLASIGCRWARCTFCRGARRDASSTAPRTVLVRDFDLLAARYGAAGICFSDECLDLSSTSNAMLELRRRGRDLGWVGETRPDERSLHLDQGLLYDSGCRLLMFGLETGSDTLRRRMGKGFDSRTAESVLQRCARSGILTHVFLMVGFPGESQADLRQTIEFLDRNEEWIASASVSCFHPWPGTVALALAGASAVPPDGASTRDVLENRIPLRAAEGPGEEIARRRRSELLSLPVVSRILARIQFAHRACASLGTRCTVLHPATRYASAPVPPESARA